MSEAVGPTTAGWPELFFPLEPMPDLQPGDTLVYSLIDGKTTVERADE